MKKLFLSGRIAALVALYCVFLGSTSMMDAAAAEAAPKNPKNVEIDDINEGNVGAYLANLKKKKAFFEALKYFKVNRRLKPIVDLINNKEACDLTAVSDYGAGDSPIIRTYANA